MASSDWPRNPYTSAISKALSSACSLINRASAASDSAFAFSCRIDVRRPISVGYLPWVDASPRPRCRSRYVRTPRTIRAGRPARRRIAPRVSGLAVRTYLFAMPTCNLPRHATAGFHSRSHCAGLAGARRSVPYASQRSTHAHVHARRHPRRGEGAASRGSAQEWRPSAARQYLSFTSAPRRGDFREVPRYSRIHELAAFSAHRLRRLPDILTAGPPHHVRGLRRVPELYGPDLSALESGAQHRDP